jgi:hypothetical protein
MRVHFAVSQSKEKPVAVYVMLMTPYQTDGGENDDAGATERLDVAAGLLAVFEPWTMLLEVAFETPLNLQPGSSTLISPNFEDLDYFGRPRLDGPYRQMISAAATALSALPPDERGRVRLALRWHNMAVRESAIDAFLKHWVAIETLAMPDTTDIRPLIQALADHYGLSYEAARDRFQIGRVFGRRAAMVHNGDMRRPHQGLLDYLGAIFMDLVRHKLGAPLVGRAGQILAQPDFDLPSYL